MWLVRSAISEGSSGASTRSAAIASVSEPPAGGPLDRSFCRGGECLVELGDECLTLTVVGAVISRHSCSSRESVKRCGAAAIGSSSRAMWRRSTRYGNRFFIN